MKNAIWLVLVLVLGFGALEVSAQASIPGTYGDDDPYPLACMNFAGEWKSDMGEVLVIEQVDCRWLRIHSKLGSADSATTIVPDDKARVVSQGDWTGEVRHRWNSKASATMIETHRAMNFTELHLEELVLLEKVNPDLILQSTYSTVTGEKTADGKDCPPKQDYRQAMFRRVSQ